MVIAQAEEYLQMAYPICLTIPRQKKHVSLIICKKRIIAIGMNFFKTHPMAKEIGYNFEEMHSELDAFRKLTKENKGKKLHLINVRFNKFGQMRMSKPCEKCLPWCIEVFHTIHYTTDYGVQRIEY